MLLPQTISRGHFVVKESKRVERLVLSGGGDFLIYGQVRKEKLDFHGPHLAGMTFGMEENVTLNPVNVHFLSPNGVKLYAKDFANLIEEFGFRIWSNLRGTFEVIGTAGTARRI